MEKANTAEKPILTRLRELEIGGSITVPASRTSYLRSVCVTFGCQWEKKFTTRLNRENRTITAIRIE